MSKGCIRAPVDLSKVDLKLVEIAAENMSDEMKEKIKIMSRITLESRSEVINTIKNILREIANSHYTKLYAIKGSWGSGKTALYVYIEDLVKNMWNSVMDLGLLRTDDLIDILKLINYKRLKVLKKHILLLGILLSLADSTLRYSIIDKIKKGDIEVIPRIVEQVYDQILTKPHFIVFVDEFERIIGEGESDKDLIELVIQALRDILGGGLNDLIHKSGKRIHVILSVTPYAYSELISRLGREYSGWFERRESVIELDPLTKLDTRVVIEELLRITLKNQNLTINDIFEKPEYADVIYKVSRGLPSSIIQTLNLLLIRAIETYTETFNENGMCKISPEVIISTLTNRQIHTFQGNTYGIDPIEYKRCIDIIRSAFRENSKHYEDLWKELICRDVLIEGKDVKVGEIYKLKDILVGDIVDVDLVPLENLEERLVEMLKREATGQDIIDYRLKLALRAVSVLVDGKYYFVIERNVTPTDLADRLSRELHRYVNISLSLQTCREIIATFYSVKANVGGLSGYKLSDNAERRLFPTPPLVELDFFENPDDAAKYWREIRNLFDKSPDIVEDYIVRFLLNKELNDGLIRGTKDLHEAKIEGITGINYFPIKLYVIMSRDSINRFIEDLKSILDSGTIPVVIIRSRLTEVLINRLRQGAPIILEHKMFEDIQSLIPIIEPRETLLLVMAVIGKILDENIRIIQKALERRAREILRAIDLSNKIKSRLSTYIDYGIILKPITTHLKWDDLVKVYKALLYGGSQFDFESFWDKLNKFKHYTAYGQRGRKPAIMPLDLEKESILNYIYELSGNGLINLSKDKENKKIMIQIISTPVEKRILSILLVEREISLSELARRFIELQRDVLAGIYLPILGAKGLIEIEKRGRKIEKIKLVSSPEPFAHKQLDKAYEKFKKSVQQIKSYNPAAKNLAVAHIAMFKEREEKVMFLDELENFINSEYNKTFNGYHYQKLLLADFIDYVDREILQNMAIILDKISETEHKIRSECEEIINKIEGICKALSETYNVKVVPKQIHEYNKALEIKGRLDSILSVSKPQIVEEVKRLRKDLSKDKTKILLHSNPLWFENPREGQNYVKYKLDKLYNEFLNIYKSAEDAMNQVSLTLREISKMKHEIRKMAKELEKYGIKSELIMQGIILEEKLVRESTSIIGLLNNYIAPIYQRYKEVHDKLKENLESITENAQKVQKLNKDLKGLKERYQNACNDYSKVKTFIDELRNILRIDAELEAQLSRINKCLKEIEKKIFDFERDLTQVNVLDKYSINKLISEYQSINNDFNDLSSTFDGLINAISAEIGNEIEKSITVVESLLGLLRSNVIEEYSEKIVYKATQLKDIANKINQILDNQSTILEQAYEIVRNLQEILRHRTELQNELQKYMEDPRVRIYLEILNREEVTLDELSKVLQEALKVEEILKHWLGNNNYF